MLYVVLAVMSSNPHLQQQQILTQLLTRTPTHTIQTWNLNIDLHSRPVPRSLLVQSWFLRCNL